MKNRPAPLRPLLRICLVGLLLLLTACATQPTPARVEPLRLVEAEVEVETQPTPSASQVPTPLPAASASHKNTGTETVADPSYKDARTPSPVPQPTLRQLTSGQCCPNPFWSADGLQVQFIDRPASRPVGMYGVEARLPSPPTLISRWIVDTTGGGEFYVYPQGNATILQRVATGEQYAIANGGRPVSVSPDGQRAMWQVIGQSGDFDKRRNQTWVADVDGSQARVVAETVGLGASQWVDAQRILLVGLPLADQPYLSSIAVLTLDPANGDQLLQIAHVSRPRGLLLAPHGHWLAYFLSFQSDPAQNGLWVVPTDGSLPPRKLNAFGSYRWRDDPSAGSGQSLLYVPLELDAPSHVLWEYDVASGEHRRLTDPALTPFKIANNDWAVSPDGRYVVFVRARDHNLWLIDLEPG